MSQLVIINLGRGTLLAGFPAVTATICASGRFEPQHRTSQLTGSLPPAPHLVALYRRWQLLYESLYQAQILLLRQEASFLHGDDDGIEIEDADVTHASETDFAGLSSELTRSLDAWLDTEGFRSLERQLRRQFGSDDAIRLVVQTADCSICQLPWSAWSFLRDYPRAEVAFSALNFESRPSSRLQGQPLRILAILGDATGIDIERDRQLLADLPGAEVTFLAEPRRQEFNDRLWDDRGWDVLFFAGHSSTHPEAATGRLYINPQDSLTVAELDRALHRAVEWGLQLAIFNSCDGLGLAHQLADVQLPQTIVMREPISDRVAQEFLKYLLQALTAGEPLLLAEREARERLQGLEGDYPGASWLPVVFQNPTATPLVWPGAIAKKRPSSSGSEAIQLTSRLRWDRLLLASSTVSLAAMGIRWLGLLQGWELQAFDLLLRLRPQEPASERLLLVTVDAEDIAMQDRLGMQRQGSLSDRALEQVLAKIVPQEPAAIGLDIYRHPPVVDPDAKAAVDRWRSDRFVDICQIGARGGEPEVLPPTGVELANVAFSDMPLDPDLVVRRQIFGMAPGSPEGCYASESLSFSIARRYLESRGIELQRTRRDRFEIGAAAFLKIEPHVGGYHRLETGGFEVLLNYRATRRVAPTVSLRDLIEGVRDEELAEIVRDRMVLVGNVDPSFKDYHRTPYSIGDRGLEEVAGVEIQAHAIAAIVSAALGERPTLWWWPQWGDALWVWTWATAGGALVMAMGNRRGAAIVAGGAAIVLLGGGCFVVLWQWGGWLPLVPAVAAVCMAVAVVRAKA